MRPLSSAAALSSNSVTARLADQPALDAERRQPLVGVVAAQMQPELGARGEHAVGLGDAPRHQIVNHHAEIALGARQDDRLLAA